MLRDLAAEEDLLFLFAEDQRADLRHAPLGDHLAGHLGGTLEVVAGPGGEPVEMQLLGDAAAHQHRDGRHQVVARVGVAVVHGKLLGHAQGAATGDDGDLVQRIGLGQRVGHQRVPGLVIGRGALLFVADDQRLALGAHQHLVLGDLEIFLRHRLAVAPGRVQRRLVGQVGQVRAAEAGRGTRDEAQLDVRRQRDLAHVDLQDLLAPSHVRPPDDDRPVEAPGPEQGRVEHVGPVRGRDEDHAVVRLEAVHFDQQLVQRLLALVVPAPEAGASMAADGVDLVDEDDAGSVLLALLEEVTNARRADADEHLHEVGAGDGEKGHAGLSRDGPGQQCFAGPRRPHQEDALRDLAAELLELLRFLEELDDLLQLLLGLLDAGHVLERYLARLGGRQLGLRLAEGQRAIAPALHLAHEEDPHAEEENHGRPGQQQRQERVVAGLLGRDVHALGVEVLDQVLVLDDVGREVLDRLAAAAGLRRLEPTAHLVAHRIPGDRDLFDVLSLDVSVEGGLIELPALLGRAVEDLVADHHGGDHHQPDHDCLQMRVHVGGFSAGRCRFKPLVRVRTVFDIST